MIQVEYAQIKKIFFFFRNPFDHIGTCNVSVSTLTVSETEYVPLEIMQNEEETATKLKFRDLQHRY